MRRARAVFVTLILAAFLPADTGAATRDPKPVLRAAAAAMGGEAALRAIRSIAFTAHGYTNLLEQSERPEGPWIPQFETIDERWDLDKNRWRQAIDARVGEMRFSWVRVVAGGAALQVFGERSGPAPASAVQAAAERLALSPVRIVLDALDDPEAARDPDRSLQGVPHHVVRRTWRGSPVWIFFNAETGLPTAVEIVNAYPEDLFWQIWGDVRTRVTYSYWDLLPGGLHLPRQWDIEKGGQPHQSMVINDLRVNEPAPAGSFDIPSEVASAFAAGAAASLDDPVLGGNGRRPPRELAPGVVVVPGSWDIALVRQPDGVVVIEAPISAGYSRKVLEEAARRFPDLPVKAVISTSDAWPHFGGVREYVARGIPVYLLDRNVPIVERALNAPHTRHPDALARSPRKPILRPVSGRTVVGSGDNRLELVPIRTETGERMLMAWLPAHRVLYGSDLVQMGRQGPPQYLSELADAVRREGLNVETVFAMHSDAMPWSRVLEIIAQASSTGPSAGNHAVVSEPIDGKRKNGV